MKALGKRSVASIIQVGLRIAWIVLWAAAICVAVAVVAYGGFLCLFAAGAIDPAPVRAGGIDLGGITSEIAVDYRGLAALSWPYIVPAILAAAVAIGGGLVIVSRLMRLFRSFASDEPFSADNAGHLRVIWIALLIMEVSRYAIAAAMQVLVLAIGPPLNVDVKVSPPISLSSWAAILVLIVLAEVFREGSRLREEEKLTI